MNSHMLKGTLIRLCNLHSGSACRRRLPEVISFNLQNFNHDAYNIKFNINPMLQFLHFIQLFPKFVPINNNIGESQTSILASYYSLAVLSLSKL